MAVSPVDQLLAKAGAHQAPGPRRCPAGRSLPGDRSIGPRQCRRIHAAQPARPVRYRCVPGNSFCLEGVRQSFTRFQLISGGFAPWNFPGDILWTESGIRSR